MRFIQTILLLLFSVTVAKAQVSVFGKVDHITPDGVDTVGGITLTVSGSTAPYTYTWNPGAINTKDIANKTAGHYTVNVLSASSQTYTNAYKIGYKVQWTNLYNAVFRNDSLFNTTDNSTAVSKNTLSSNTDGWFEYVFTSLPAANHLIGFSDSISPIHTTADIDYGIYYDGPGNRLYSLNTGSTSVIIKTGVKTGDVVRVERISGNVVKFFVNNTAVKTVTISGVYSKTFKLKAYFSGTTKLNDVGCSFMGFDNNSIPNYVRLKPYIRHNSGYGSNDGLIKVTPRISFSNTYSWSPGGATTSSVTSLSPGLNKVTVKDSLLNSSSHYYNVGYKVQWTNLDMCSVVGDSLLTSATSNYKATANSKNVLRSGENGWIEYVVEKITGENIFIGFTDSLAPVMGTTGDIDYGVNFNPSSGYLYYIEGASTAAIYTNLAAGDLVKIERSGNTVYYKVNNVVVGSATASTISSKTFRIKAGITNADYIARVGCSFYNNDSTNFKNYVQVYKTVKHNSGSGINDGLVLVTPKISGTTTYTWMPGSINTNSVSGVSMGNYTVSATDNMSNTTPHELNVGYKAKWTNLSNCFFRNDTIKGTGPNNTYIGSAYSKNVLHANEDGWVEYVVKSYQANATWLGFADSSANTIASATEILYGLQTPGFFKTLSAVEGSSAPLIFSYVRIGDVLRVERVGNSILYKINGVVLRTVTSSSIGPKVLKLKIRLQYNNELANVGASFAPCTFTMSAGSTQTITCTTPSVVLTGTTNLSGASYSWSPGSISTSTASVTSPGTYTLAVSSSSGQCVAQSTVAVVSPFSATSTITEYINDTIKGQVQMCIKGGSSPYRIVWNNQKNIIFDSLYTYLSAATPSLSIDTANLRHFVDSLRTTTLHKDLEPGIYPATIYDSANDSIQLVNVVTTPLNWAISNGMSFTTTPLPSRQVGSKTYYYGMGNNLTQSGSFHLGQSIAYATNPVTRNYNHFFQFTVPNASDTIGVGLIYMTDKLDTIPQDSAVRASMVLKAGVLKIKIFGSNIYSGTYAANDVFAIENDTALNKIYFYKNNVLLAQDAYSRLFAHGGAPAQDTLLFAVSMGNAGASLQKLIGKTKVAPTVTITASITDASCDNTCSGSINAYGSTAMRSSPVKYELFSDAAPTVVIATVNTFAGINHAVFNNLCPGKYHVKYSASTLPLHLYGSTPPVNVAISLPFEVGYLPDWQNRVATHVLLPYNSLEKNATGAAGASTSNILHNSSTTQWAEFKTSGQYDIAFGLSNTDPDQALNSVNYGFYVYKNSNQYIYAAVHNGTAYSLIAGPTIGLATANSTYKIEKASGVITFKVDNVTVRVEPSVTNATLDFIGDASVTYNTGYILKPRFSFGCGFINEYAVPTKKLDGGYYTVNNKKLLFKYDEEYKDTDGKLKFNIYNSANVVVYSSASMVYSPAVNYGDNRFALDLSDPTYYVSGQSMPANNFYVLEIVNEKNEKWYLRFKI